jgi:uncharacterized protein YecE (DUF72 family)
MMKIKVGCCGWPLSLKKYTKIFSLVEIQKTFYKLPKEETVERWRREVMEEFEFVVKAPQLITHPPTSPTYRKAGITVDESKKDRYGLMSPTEEVFKVWNDTFKLCRILKAKLVLFQTPASFSEKEEHVENLRGFFNMVERKDLTFMWEPRGKWSADTLKSIFEELDLIHVVDPFKDAPLYGEILYFRLHGRGKGYRYKYSDEELRELLDLIKRYGEGKKEVYILFNNTEMLDDAKRFSELIGQYA